MFHDYKSKICSFRTGRIGTKLSSVQLMLVAAGLGGIAAIFPAFVEYLPWWLNLILGAGLPMAAVVARLWAQPEGDRR